MDETRQTGGERRRAKPKYPFETLRVMWRRHCRHGDRRSRQRLGFNRGRTAGQLEAEQAKQEFEGYFGGFSIAGKLMSYIALGKVFPELLTELPGIFEREFEVRNTFEHRFERAAAHGSGFKRP